MSFLQNADQSQAFDRLKTQAFATKEYLLRQRTAMQAATCDAAIPLAVIQHLATVDALMTTLAATPGLAAYAKAATFNSNYDVAAEFNAMKSAIGSAATTLMGTFPKDGGGFLLYQTFVNGAPQNRTFTAAQLASVVAVLDAVVATI